jgi:hypothetical protein
MVHNLSDHRLPTGQCGKFVLRGGEIPRALSMLSIYLLLNFRNLPRALCKLSRQADWYTFIIYNMKIPKCSGQLKQKLPDDLHIMEVMIRDH